MILASGYAAVALSSDALMGDDTVVECVHENGDINMYTSFTMTDRSGSTRHPVSYLSVNVIITIN